ncbi:YqgE/AlgH family protein [Roseibium sp. RKSG952]|uniref:YqgE/AlgH family protein n=1 Tax=Roseibium sp. RKSG952 TaxID=2529384 RepID=UPI0012BD6A3C|nr:YqgE/AlgH family protein [Roseibium sp. RKSG952]MTI00579.1 YqgE/AlgH family protein [Roseibium sp. RKSG952]
MANLPAADSLEGKFLIAMPNMADGRFENSVIYMCSHSDQGAMGLVLNQVARHLSLKDLLLQLDILNDETAIRLPSKVSNMNVFKGGPVEVERGFVLHSDDYVLEQSTLEIANGVCLTATLEILKAIADGSGPEHAILALGYSGWAPGQLEKEIQANGWLTSDADKAILFDTEFDNKWHKALSALGVDPAMLYGEAGHA